MLQKNIHDGNIINVQYSVFGSIMTVGGIVGAILSGKLADLIGRRRVSVFIFGDIIRFQLEVNA